MNFSKILLESKVDDFKTKYSQKFGVENTEKIAADVMPKFLDWTGRHMDAVNFEDNFHKIVRALNTFEKISHNLPITDLNQYQGMGQLFSELLKYSEKERREVKKVEGGNLVYEDEKFYVVNPLTHAASCYYGKGTKWCTAATGDEHFKKYNSEGKLFYIIDKTKPTSDYYYKVAILRNFDGTETYWDSKDDDFKTGWILGTNEFDKIKTKIVEYMASEYDEQIKIYTDKELAKKERDRLYRLREEQVLRERLNDAEERRLDGEWELGPNCPEIGLRAHALLDWLVDTSDVSALTNEDRVEIQRLKDEIERLQTQYDAEEETNIGLLDEISDMEDELTELEGKIDVYNIIPEGGHYQLKSFVVINNADLDGREYAVGDNYEMQKSCEENVDALIDDVGYEGFNNGFAKSYIDTDAIEEHARDTYDNDVSENGDSYFQDSERELSDSQEERIKILESKIERENSTKSQFEEMIENTEDEEEIDELQNKIDDSIEMIEEMESEIEDIKDDPQGDFPEELIDSKVNDLVDDAVNDPEEYMNNFGLEWSEFVNKDDFIQGVIDADGFGNTISSYDGNADEVSVEGESYWVIRLN